MGASVGTSERLEEGVKSGFQFIQDAGSLQDGTASASRLNAVVPSV